MVKDFFCIVWRYLLPLLSGTRTIEPGRALIMVPAANGIDAAETGGADVSWLFEYDDAATDGPCDALESLPTLLACVLVVTAAAALTLGWGTEVPEAGGASLSS